MIIHFHVIFPQKIWYCLFGSPAPHNIINVSFCGTPIGFTSHFDRILSGSHVDITQSWINIYFEMTSGYISNTLPAYISNYIQFNESFDTVKDGTGKALL